MHGSPFAPRLAAGLAAALLLGASPRLAPAQGTVGGQGFGYAPGQLSTRVLTLGGANAELDPQSPANPAALATLGRPTLFLQYEPEFRRVELGDVSDGSRLIRFPVLAIGMPFGSRATFGLSASTLLDRTWSSQFTSSQPTSDGTVEGRGTFQSEGAINDVRLAGAWAFAPGFRLGAGVHAITGQNRLAIAGIFEFPDSSVGALDERSELAYSGFAASVGADWRPSTVLAIAGSVRKGSTLKSYRNDTAQTSARVPDRFGASIGYAGIRGASLGVSSFWEGWSKMESLRDPRTSSLRAFDSWGVGAGAELAGPTWFQFTIPLRVGVRYRTLPFGVQDAQPHELAVAGGLGLTLARGRSSIDLGVQRASRSASGVEARESAWTLSMGITVRP
jgi:hypothetical protein